jgi:thymidine kinase
MWIKRTFAYKSFKSSSVDNGLGLDLTQAGKLLVFKVGSFEFCSSLVPTSSKILLEAYCTLCGENSEISGIGDLGTISPFMVTEGPS